MRWCMHLFCLEGRIFLNFQTDFKYQPNVRCITPRDVPMSHSGEQMLLQFPDRKVLGSC